MLHNNNKTLNIICEIFFVTESSSVDETDSDDFYENAEEMSDFADSSSPLIEPGTISW